MIGSPSVDVPFDVRLDQDAHVVVRGDIDLGAAPRLASALEAASSANPARVTVDLGGVTMLDSSGLAALVNHQRHLGSRGGVVVLTSVPASVAHVLDVAGVAAVFPVVEDGRSARF